ncbi:Sec-independent protein translocase subunit TatA/TatB [Hufsiella ginkgonis]|uniref:Sec-independent protein translocase protein TatA n=1 Tax=Hufsiella ginkgonis TaxID=2695274 RepID=A0A7K1Y3T5_9SPHI|nr:twin-arginine translocase TatA/TatE family subunit [Hufsiella ginkgonis]MXV17943.1 twin-arginine translocase TatA/TatE family subunit [Hufsiella ginkgonis]
MYNTLLIAGLGGPEIIVIVLIVLLLFGGKKIPELMRGLGRGVKEFKDAKDSDAPVSEEPRKNV